MNDLSEPCRRVLTALIAAPVAWLTPSHLAARAGGNRDATYDALAELDSAGWLDPWEIDGDVYVTLSTFAAERLAVRLVPGGKSDTMRWVPISDPEPCPRVLGRSQGVEFDLIVDSRPGPDMEAEVAERAERLARRPAETAPDSAPGEKKATLPHPSILLGSGLTPWPGPGQSRGPVCPGCKSEPISEKAYCLVCDRWGLDALLAARADVAPVRRATPNSRPACGDRCAAKLARKEKHRRKMEERIEQEHAKRKEGARPIAHG
jgi:hypothetical protein